MGTLRKLQEESGYALNESKSRQWIRPFHITDLIKRNAGALSRILNYESDVHYGIMNLNMQLDLLLVESFLCLMTYYSLLSPQLYQILGIICSRESHSPARKKR